MTQQTAKILTTWSAVALKAALFLFGAVFVERHKLNYWWCFFGGVFVGSVLWPVVSLVVKIIDDSIDYQVEVFEPAPEPTPGVDSIGE